MKPREITGRRASFGLALIFLALAAVFILPSMFPSPSQSATAVTAIYGWDAQCEAERGLNAPECEFAWHIATRTAAEAALVQPAPPPVAPVDPAMAAPPVDPAAITAPIVPVAPSPLPEERITDTVDAFTDDLVVTGKGAAVSWQILQNGGFILALLIGAILIGFVIWIAKKITWQLVVLVGIVGVIILATRGIIGWPFAILITLLLGLIILGSFGFNMSSSSSMSINEDGEIRQSSKRNAGFQGQAQPAPKEKEIDF